MFYFLPDLCSLVFNLWILFSSLSKKLSINWLVNTPQYKNRHSSRLQQTWITHSYPKQQHLQYKCYEKTPITHTVVVNNEFMHIYDLITFSTSKIPLSEWISSLLFTCALSNRKTNTWLIHLARRGLKLHQA